MMEMTRYVCILYSKDDRYFHCLVPGFEQNLPTSKKKCHLPSFLVPPDAPNGIRSTTAPFLDHITSRPV